jgi:hypothetical protein
MVLSLSRRSAIVEAQVIPFRRPDLVIFERFDPEDMAAMFRCRKGGDTYCFTMLINGDVDDAHIERDSALLSAYDDFSAEQVETFERIVRSADGTYREQLATWNGLTPGEKITLLIAWSHDTVLRLKDAIRAAATADAIEYKEEIALMCHDLDSHDAYMSGLETALSLL